MIDNFYTIPEYELPIDVVDNLIDYFNDTTFENIIHYKLSEYLSCYHDDKNGCFDLTFRSKEHYFMFLIRWG